MKKTLFISILLSAFSPIVNAQITPNSTGYVIEQTPRQALTTLTNATTYTQVQSSISYVDGLGRPLQTVMVKASGDATQDVLSNTNVYDNYGRLFKSFLAIPSSGALGGKVSNPQTLGEGFYGDTHPYTQVSAYDNSALNRPTESYGAGKNWRVTGNLKPSKIFYHVPASNTVIYFQAGLAGVGANTSSLNQIQKAQHLATGKSFDFEGITAADYTHVANSAAPTLRYYGSSDLTMITYLSERGKKIVEYRDLQDRVIRKDVEVSSDTTLTTHYLYDIFERLAYVIPPEAYKLFSNSKLTMAETDAEFRELVYAYRYDKRGRLIRKHLAGVGWTEICYDKRDLPVLTQDPQEAAQSPKQWQFMRYDAFGRVVMSGITDSYNSADREAAQTAFEGVTTAYENATTTGLGYSNQSFPSSIATTDAQVMKVNYYDDYSSVWLPTDLGFLTGVGGDAPFSTTQMNGMLLGYKERNLATNTFYTTTMYYDDRKRMVNSNTQNHVGGKDRISINYSFTGEVLKALKTTDKGTTATKITEMSEYTYDHWGRKKTYRHSINGATQNVANYSYDAIGRLVQKGLKPAGLAQSSKQTGNWNDGNSWLSSSVPTLSDAVTINAGHTLTIGSGQSGSAGSLTDRGSLAIQTGGQFNLGKVNENTLQNVDFSYHIRGGLRGINLDASGNVALNGGDLFSVKLGYEDDGTYFDGNIRSQTWKSSIDNISRTYTYRYDGASRIKAGVFTGGKPNENYTLGDVTYDNNGNIKKLIRSGLRTNNSFGVVDNLVYTYQANSNKIQAVTDNSNETASFTDEVGATDYTYNPDGSLKSDANKSINLFEYNYLKLPKKITFADGKTVSYQYSASGKKLKETTSTGDVTDYVGNVIYKNGSVYQISHDEGRLVPNALGGYTYEYDIKDHLGSLRVSFKDSVGIAKVTQESHTGVFGEVLPSLVYTNTPKVNNFDYTDHERLKTFNLGYIDAGARLYDPFVPRFTTIDPLAETSRRFSPYTYGNNNPIRFIDPDGMEAEEYPRTNVQYSNGYTTSNSRDNTGAVTFEGAYLNADGGGTPTAIEAALIAKHVYGGKDANVKLSGGWRPSNKKIEKLNTDSRNGYKAALYEKEVNGQIVGYVYAYAGTDDKQDAIQDITQASIGFLDSQYGQAKDNALIISEVLSKELTFVGHSLGGGLASLSALITGKGAYTFNAAGLSDITELRFMTFYKSEHRIRAYYILGEILSHLQDNSPFSDSAEGIRIPLNAPSLNSFGNHSIDRVIQSLQKK